MKKILSIFIILVLLLVAAIVIVPFALKGKINEIVLKKANQSVNASINYESYNVTLIKSFPDLNATFSGVSLIGVDEFEGDTLAAFSELSVQIDFPSLLKKEGIIIESITLNDGFLNLIENEEGKANWDIEKEVTHASVKKKKTNEQNDGANSLKLLLQDVIINNFDFVYTSIKGNYSFSTIDLSGGLSGTMEGLNTLLDIEVNTPSVNLTYDSISYVKNGKVSLSTQLNADLDNYNFNFKTGSSQINGLPIALKGGFSMPNDSMLFDMVFDVPEINMNQLLEQVPDSYKKYLKDIEAEGNITLNGEVNGLYFEDVYPKFKLSFTIHGGEVKYPDLPDELKIHELKAEIRKPEGAFDLITLGISNMELQLAQNPFTMHADFSSLFTDPFIDLAIDGIIDMGTLTKVIPLGDSKIRGLLTADATIKGNYSALEKNDFASFISAGSVDLKNFYLQNSSLPQGVSISNAALVLKNQDVTVKGLNGKIGKSDFSLKGQLQQIITYVFANDELKGQFELKSELLDLNEFMQAYQPEKKPENEVYVKVDSTKDNSQPLVFPANVSMDFDAEISHLLFDQLDISAFDGELILMNQKLTLKGLKMDMIGGELKMNGTVIADGRITPAINLNLNILNFDLPTAHKQITMVQKYMPFAAKSQGDFSTLLNVKSKVSTDLKMILSSVSANGTFSTHNLKLVDAVYFSNLKSVINYNKLKNLEVDDFTTSYSIEDGSLKINPLKTKLANQPISIEGVYKLGGTLDFRVDANVDKELLSNDIQNMIAYIPGHQNVKKVDVGLNIKGDAKKPDVTVDTNKIKKQVLDQLKNSSQEDIENAAKKLLQELFK